MTEYQHPRTDSFIGGIRHCFFLWGILTLALHIAQGHALPYFTQQCVNLRPLTIALPILAAGYCLWIWFRKANQLPTWVVFFAATMSILVLATLPTFIAALLPLINVAGHLASN